MIHVIATIETEAGKRGEVVAALLGVTPAVLAEDGCIEYGAAIDFDSGLPVQPPVRENVITVVEKWRDLAALKAHTGAPHMVDYRTKIAGLVKRVTLAVLEPAT